MRKVHIIGAGGPAGVGLSRCLKDRYELTGEEGSKWARLMMEVPEGDRNQAEMIVSPPDSAVGLNSFCPPVQQIRLCADKSETAKALGKLAPEVLWVRDTRGAGGSGAQMCQEMLPGANYSVEFVCFHDTKVASFQKRRLSYSVKSVTQGTENRGSSAVSVVTDLPNVWRRAEEALTRLSEATRTELHGFYGVDLKCDGNGTPKVTEINAGRLLTASYEFFCRTGYNLPLVGCELHLGNDMPLLPDYPAGWGQIRQVGQPPKLFGPEITRDWL